MSDKLKDLKPGDEVVMWRGGHDYQIVTVSRRTPSQIIICDRRFRAEDGVSIGGSDSYFPYQLTVQAHAFHTARRHAIQGAVPRIPMTREGAAKLADILRRLNEWLDAEEARKGAAP